MIFTKHISTFLLLTGAGTAVAFIYAIMPALALEHLNSIIMNDTHKVFIQHWGVVVGIVGCMMIAAAIRPQWRESILILCTLEKAYMVFLFLLNFSTPTAGNFMLFAIADSLIVLYILGYWFEQGGIYKRAAE